MEDEHSSKDQESEPQGGHQPRVVTEFEVRERDVALRIRVERWPSSPDASDDDTLVEAGYGHGV